MTMKFLLHKDKEKRKIQPTKARVWLPFPAINPSQPHTCFYPTQTKTDNKTNSIFEY